MIQLNLPWPPSVNHYYQRTKRGTSIGPRGINFRAAVAGCVQSQTSHSFDEQRIRIRIVAYPPDRRRRDLDNILKATLDALEHSGLYANDYQIADLQVLRGMPCKCGRLSVAVWQCNDEPQRHKETPHHDHGIHES